MKAADTIIEVMITVVEGLGMRLDVDYVSNLHWNSSNAGKAPLGPKSDYQSALILIEQGVQTCLMLRGEHKMLPMT